MDKVVISIEETADLARFVAKKLQPGDVLALYGNLGTGKTTFTHFLVEELGIKAKVQSPSFVLARIYENTKDEAPSPIEDQNKKIAKIERINHLDLYRLQSTTDVENLDLSEYFEEQNAITIIEWPEIAEEFLPPSTKKITFEDLGEDKRKINFIE